MLFVVSVYPRLQRSLHLPAYVLSKDPVPSITVLDVAKREL